MPMLDPATVAAFVASALILLVLPGPAVLYIVTQSVANGTRAGAQSALGLLLGAMLHLAAAVLGISALLATSGAAFHVVKLCGAAYLVYLGVREFVGVRRQGPERTGAPPSGQEIVVQGFWVNVLNPKAAVFFLAYLPQFVRPESGGAAAQVLMFGAIFLALALMTDLTYAVAAGWAGQRFSNRLENRQSGRYAAGLVYIGLGLVTALGRFAG